MVRRCCNDVTIITLSSEKSLYFVDSGSGALRLVAINGQTLPTLTAGRLEVSYNGQWGTVCYDNFGPTEASIACRQLGFSLGYLDYTAIGTR